jgi:ribosomal-protein-alanine N-acetyltransferase
MAEIETARLRLRPFTLDDIDSYYRAVVSDPDVMRYLPGRVPRPYERTEPMIRFYMEHQAQHGFAFWAVIHQAEDRLIGHAGLQYIPNTPEIEVGYALASAYWGQGLAPEAAHAALRYGFETLGLDRIVAVAVPENAASQRVMLKIGMRYEKIAQVYGTDLPCYAIERDAFQPGDAPYVVR